MSAIYDNWERLVAATLKREAWRESALASSRETSFSSSLADDASYLSHTYSFNSALRLEISRLQLVSRGFAGRAARLFRAVSWFRRKNRQEQDHPVEEDPDFPHPGLFKRFSLKELQAATDNFSTRNIVGMGAYGSVFKGRLMDGSLVAVKSLPDLEFQTEIEIMSLAAHQNIIHLRGYCMTPERRMLVYPYMANGSVAQCLRERPESQPPLNWPTRKRIALGAAMGLAYLHDDCNLKIIHRSVHVATILLDESFEAVFCGFGLAMLMDNEETDVQTDVCGTIDHIAPEYWSAGRCSVKTDVYAYGITLLELISGQRAFDLARLANDDDVMLVDWVFGLVKDKKLESLVDGDLAGNYIDSEVEQLIQVALLCTQSSPIGRPEMSEVIMMLESEDWWKEWQNPLPPNIHRIIEESDIEEDTLSEPR